MYTNWGFPELAVLAFTVYFDNRTADQNFLKFVIKLNFKIVVLGNIALLYYVQ